MLINCRECAKQISDQAAACPHCGYPIQEENEFFSSEVSNAYETLEQTEPAQYYGLSSFVLAITSLFLPVMVFDMILAILAIILSFIGLKAKKRGFAVAGLVIGIIAFLASFAWYQ